MFNVTTVSRPRQPSIHTALAIFLAFSLLVIAVAGSIKADETGDSQAGLVVSEHDPVTAPEDFYVPHPVTGELRPYVFFDESTPAEQRLRIRILAATAAGYQDFVFDGPSGSMSIHAGDEVILERFNVRTEDPSNGRGQVPSRNSDGSERPFEYQLNDDFVEITHHEQINPAIERLTVFRIGFQGQNPLHQVTTELRMPGNGNAQGAKLRSWFRIQGPPVEVNDKRVEHSAVTSEDDAVEPLDLGNLTAEWIEPSSGLVEQHSSADDSIELSPTDSAAQPTGKMTISIGAETPSSSVTVTSRDHFELIFMSKKGGGIQYWYDLQNDPGRTQNLVRRNGNLFAHRIRVGGGYYFTSKRGSMEVVSYDSTKAVVRQFGTYNNGSPTLTGTTYEIVYTIWASGQVGIELVNRTSVSRAVDQEERQVQVSSAAWQAFTQYGDISSNNRSHSDADYIGFSLDGSGGSQLNADVALVQRTDWARSDLLYLRSNSSGYDMGWKSRTSTVWPAGYAETVNYELLIKPDSLDSFDAPEPYAIDYRSPAELTVAGGSGTGFDFPSVAYGIDASSDYMQFELGTSVARFQPRFVISNWSGTGWSLSFAGEELAVGEDYLVDHDAESGTLSLIYLGVVPANSAGTFTLRADGVVPTITSLSPPLELSVIEESGGFAIPYIQESTTLEIAAEVEDLPPGGGVEFLINGNSTMDSSAPFALSVSLTPGEHSLEAYIVDYAGNRLTNPEAMAFRPQIGIGTITTTIGDSITAGNNGDSWDSPIIECEQSPYSSPDCRNYFQHSASSGVWYAGYQIQANQCLVDATGAAQFLLNDGYGGISSQGIVDRMDEYIDHIESLGASRVFLLVGTNDGNQLVSADEWQANVTAIITNLVSAGVDPSDIYLGHVPYRLGGGTLAQERRERMQEYNARIPAIAADTGATIGPDFYTYYEGNQHLFDDNLHFTQEGYNAMGGLWTAAATGSTHCVP